MRRQAKLRDNIAPTVPTKRERERAQEAEGRGRGAATTFGNDAVQPILVQSSAHWTM